MLKWYLHFVVALISAAFFLLAVPTLFSQDSDMAVLIAIGIILIYPVAIYFYIKAFVLGKKKPEKVEDTSATDSDIQTPDVFEKE